MRRVVESSWTKSKTCKGRKILIRATSTIDPHCLVSCKTKVSGEPVHKPAVDKGKPLLYSFPRIKKIMSQHHTETLVNKVKGFCDSNLNFSFGRNSHVQQVAPGRHPASARKIKTDKTSKIETWNERTLHQKGKLENVVKDMARMKLNILGFAEVRWTGADSM
ncbi:craniofacial development protein 2-like [Plakobranchus ocellatus]|uniref:Craniofacial development protein 2-like n=1 Tax=Plakobranchus ocellatus TaxID=259542 RepID=A0AAV4CGK2_9GAST|nr:craniofacial development protein 2-like [Plakobranchus ocellatus]